MSLDILNTTEPVQRRVLIFGGSDKNTSTLKQLILGQEFEFTPSIYEEESSSEALSLVKQFHPDCVIATGITGMDLFYELERLNITSAKILLCDTADFETIKDAINRCGVFRILFNPVTKEELASAIINAVEYIDISRYNSVLVARAEARTRYLVKLKEALEHKGIEQQTDIETSAFAIKGINTEFEVMNSVLNSLQGVDDTRSIEVGVGKALFEHMDIKSVKVNLGQKDNEVHFSTEGFLSLPLFCSGCSLGEITFQKEGVFCSHEIDFLEKVSDVVAVSVEKIVHFYALEKIKRQWEASFDSIDDPIVIVDDRFNILRANKAFAESTGGNLKDIAGRKCYDVFQTKRSKIPCVGCNIRKAFTTGLPVGSEVTAQSDKRFYTTWSYPIKDNEQVLSAVHFYKDISDQINYRERLVYSEKLAEIGILAGSVAHEINNPVGGIIALLQILISEAKEHDQYYEDLKEMERAAQRCKQIVDNLLHFSRTSKDEEIRDLEFSSVFKTLVPLVELQIRHENIKLKIDADGSGLFVKAVFNELVQSLMNIINTSMELISKKGVPGFISISAKRDSSMLLLEVSDNGIPVNTVGTGFGSLALFVTEKIVKGCKGYSSFEHNDGQNKYRLYFPLSASESSGISLPVNAETRP